MTTTTTPGTARTGGYARNEGDFSGTASRRELRVLLALLDGPRTREEVDRLVHASNGPDIIRRLRRKGASITTDLVPHTTADGERARHGLYSLTRVGRRTVREWLRGAADTTPHKGQKGKTGTAQSSTGATR